MTINLSSLKNIKTQTVNTQTITTISDANIGGNLTVTGNLAVTGTTYSVDSTVTTIKDPVVSIGGGAGGAALTVADNKDRGVSLSWFSPANLTASGTTATAAAKTAFFGLNTSTGRFTVIPEATITNEKATGVIGEIDAKLSPTNLLGVVAGNTNKYLSGAGTWTDMPTSVTSASVFTALGSTATATPTAGNSATKVLTQAGTWVDTLTETTYTPTVAGSPAAAVVDIDFSTVNSTTIIVNLPTGVTSATMNFKNLSSKALTNTAFSFNVIINHTSTLTATTSYTWQAGAGTTMSAVKWAGAINPPATVTAGATDIFTFFTYNAGVSLVGSLAMQDVR